MGVKMGSLSLRSVCDIYSARHLAKSESQPVKRKRYNDGWELVRIGLTRAFYRAMKRNCIRIYYYTDLPGKKQQRGKRKGNTKKKHIKKANEREPEDDLLIPVPYFKEFEELFSYSVFSASLLLRNI